MISDLQKARIVQLRGLGYQQREIAKPLKLSQAHVAYHLQELRKLSREKGPDSVYLNILVYSSSNSDLNSLINDLGVFIPKNPISNGGKNGNFCGKG